MTKLNMSISESKKEEARKMNRAKKEFHGWLKISADTSNMLGVGISAQKGKYPIFTTWRNGKVEKVEISLNKIYDELIRKEG